MLNVKTKTKNVIIFINIVRQLEFIATGLIYIVTVYDFIVMLQ